MKIQKNRFLLVLTLTLTIITSLPALNIIGNSSTLIGGIPLTVWWLLACFFSFMLMIVAAYHYVFKEWSEASDTPHRD